MTTIAEKRAQAKELSAEFTRSADYHRCESNRMSNESRIWLEHFYELDASLVEEEWGTTLRRMPKNVQQDDEFELPLVYRGYVIDEHYWVAYGNDDIGYQAVDSEDYSNLIVRRARFEDYIEISSPPDTDNLIPDHALLVAQIDAGEGEGKFRKVVERNSL